MTRSKLQQEMVDLLFEWSFCTEPDHIGSPQVEFGETEFCLTCVGESFSNAEHVAILAERERCAKVIEREILDEEDSREAEAHNDTMKVLAAAIREEPK